MSEIVDLMNAGLEDMMMTLGEVVAVRAMPGGDVKSASCVLSTVPVAYPVALGGAVVDCSATGVLRKADFDVVRVGWRLTTGDGRVYEVVRVESGTHEPMWHVDLTRRS